MHAENLSIAGAWLIKSQIFEDDRGHFVEWFKKSSFESIVGEKFTPVQANISKSKAGVVRGIHYSLAPDGQAKLVTVLHGSIRDLVVDIRVGSPTFGKTHAVTLVAGDGCALFLSKDLGHGFQALEDNTVVSYLVSSEYSPNDEKEITPLCPTLNIQWSPDLPVVLSDKDHQAPGIDLQKENNLLPKYKAS
jgi:dTDP-4-dehydrorhamnose 3,5-epimerase